MPHLRGTLLGRRTVAIDDLYVIAIDHEHRPALAVHCMKCRSTDRRSLSALGNGSVVVLRLARGSLACGLLLRADEVIQ